VFGIKRPWTGLWQRLKSEPPKPANATPNGSTKPDASTSGLAGIGTAYGAAQLQEFRAQMATVRAAERRVQARLLGTVPGFDEEMGPCAGGNITYTLPPTPNNGFWIFATVLLIIAAGAGALWFTSSARPAAVSPAPAQPIVQQPAKPGQPYINVEVIPGS
jgi:hypothetical protein